MTPNLLETDFDLALVDSSLVAESSALPMSRRALLLAGAAAAALLALPVLPASAAFGLGDTNRVRLLEEIVCLQADFSTKAALSTSADALSERESAVINQIAREDAEVVRWFDAARDKYHVTPFGRTSTLNQASSRPIRAYRFPLVTFDSHDELLSRAIEIKSLAVGGFHDAVGNTTDPKLVQAFAALGGVQGRHLAMLCELAKQPPFVPFETPMPLADAAKKLVPYGFNMEVAGI